MRKRNGLSALLADAVADTDTDVDAGRVGVEAEADAGRELAVEEEVGTVRVVGVVEVVDAETEAAMGAAAAGSALANSTRMIFPFHLAPSYVLMARFTLAGSQ